MSANVDQRVVEMKFDNQHFERNVSTTMSTLDKLKQALHLPGAAKGMEDVGNAAKKVDMTALGKGVEDVRMKFSALQVMGVTALTNITNSAINAGKRIVESLTVAPVKDGWSEYEMTLNAVQTTMAGTGKTAEEVEKELKKLDEYADKTVYSTSDMLNNLPKFTNAGVELEVATKAMIGIANATAHAGGDASKASIAFYNLGQAIGTGYLTRMDYNSINNAGIATMEWKNQMIEAAIAAGTLTKAGDDLYKVGGKTMTMQQLFIDGLQHQWATKDVMLEVFEAYGDETTDIGKRAYSSAQDIKTFSMMMESLKATAGTGWKDTWQQIFGGLEDAKKFWTGITNVISNVITTIDDMRNRFLEIALNFNKPWAAITEKLSGLKKVIEPIEGVIDPIKNVIGTLGEFQDIVDRVWMGEFNNWGDNPDRRDLLTAAGYDYRVVQYLVNLGEETWHAGQVYQLTMEDIEAAHAHYGLTFNKTNDKIVDSNGEVIDSNGSVSESIYELSDAQLEKLGLTEDEIKLYRALEKEAKRQGITMAQLADEMSKMTGRERLIESFKNIGKAIGEVFSIAKTSYMEIFNPPGIEELAIRLFGIIKTFQEWTEKLKASLIVVDAEGKATGELTETGEKLKRTFKGVFAILHIVATLVGGPLKIAFKLITGLLAALDIPILDVTASIGDAVVAFDKFLTSALDFEQMFRNIFDFFKEFPTHMKAFWESFKQTEIFIAALPLIEAIRDRILELVEAVKKSSAFKGVVAFFKPFIDGIKSWWAGLKEAENIPKYLFDGLINGLKAGASRVWGVISDVIVRLIEIVKDALGIHSPSAVFMAIGGFIVAGLLIGLTGAFPQIWDAVGGFVDKLLGLVGKVDWGAILTGIVTVGSTLAAYKFSNFFSGLGSTLDGFGDVLSGVGTVMIRSAGAIRKVIKNTAKVIKSFSKVLNGVAWDLKAGAIQKFAIALAIIIASFIALALAVKFLEPEELWTAGVMLVLFAGILVGMAFAMEKLSATSVAIGKGGLQLRGLNTLIIQLGITMLLLAITMKIMGGMKWGDLAKGVVLIIGFAVLVKSLIAATKLAGANPIQAAMTISKVGALISAVGTAFLLLAIASKIIGSMDWEDLGKAIVALAAFGAILAALIAVTKYGAFNVNQLATMMSQVGIAFLLLAVATRILGGMSWDQLGVAAVGILGLSGIIVGLIFATKLAGPNLVNIGPTLLAVAGAIAILAVAIKLMASMSWDQLAVAGAGIAGLSAIVVGLIAATRLAGTSAPKIAATLLAIAGAIAILTIVIIILGAVAMLKPEVIYAGIGIVTALGVMIGVLISVCKSVSYANKTITSLALLIGVLAVILIALAFVPWQKLVVPVLAMGLIIGLLAIPIKQLSGFRQGSKAMGTILALAAVIAVLGTVMIILAHTPVEQCLAAAVGLSAMLVALAFTFKTISKASLTWGWKDIAKTMLVLVGLVAIVGILATILYLFRDLPPVNTISTAGSLALLLGTLLGSVLVLSKIRVNAADMTRAIGSIGVLALVLIEIGIILSLIKDMEIGGMKSEVIMLASLLVLLTGVMAVCAGLGKIMGNNMKGAAGMAITIAGIAALGLIIWELAGILADIKKLNIGGMESEVKTLVGLLLVLTVVMAACAGLGMAMSATGLMGGVGMAITIAGIAALGLVIWELGGILAEIKKLKIGGIESEVKMLINLLLALTVVAAACVGLGIAMAATGLLGGVGMAIAIAGIAALGLVIWELGGILKSIKLMNIGGVEPEVKLLTKLLYDLIPILTACALIGLLGLSSVGGAVGIAAIGLVVWEIGWVLSQIKKMDIDGIESEVAMITKFLEDLMPILAVCTAVGFATPMALGGIAALVALIGAIGGLVLAAGAIMSIPGLDKFLDTGIESLEKLAYGIGSIASNFAEGLTSGLPKIGENLSGFARNLETFINTMNGEGMDTVVDNSGKLVEAILLLTASDFLDGINNIDLLGRNGGSSLSKLGEDLSEFATNAGGFITAIGSMKPETATAIEAFSNAIASLFGASALNTILPVDVGEFGKRIAEFADSIEEAAYSLSGLSDEDVTNIKRAADAGKALAELNKSIPLENGLWQSIAGSQNLAEWGTKIVAFGESLIAFSNVVSRGNINSEAIQSSAEAATHVSKLNEGIPVDGGLWQYIAGRQDLADWGAKIVTFGKTLVDYSAIVSAGSIDADAIKNSANAAMSIAEVNNAIPTTGGLWSLIAGDKDIVAFGDGMVSLAKGLVEYANAAVQIDSTKIEAIKNTGTAIDEIKAVTDKIGATSDLGQFFVGSVDVKAFGDGIYSLANGIKSYCDVAATISEDDIAAIGRTKLAIAALKTVIGGIPEDINVAKVTTLRTAIINIALVCQAIDGISRSGYDYSCTDTLKTHIDKLLSIVTDLSIDDIVDKFTKLVTAIKKAVACAGFLASLGKYTYTGIDSLKEALKSLAQADIDGVIAAFSDVNSMSSAVATMVNAMTSGLNDGVGRVREKMKELVDAAIAGITSQTDQFETVGSDAGSAFTSSVGSIGNVAAAIVSGENLGNGAASGASSRYDKMKTAGLHLVKGFVAGIGENTWRAEAKAKAMADAAEKAARKALDINSPSRVFKEIGSGIPEGFAMGIGMLGGDVKDSVQNMTDTALSATSNVISRISDLINADIDSQPTIRPVLDLSDVQSGAGALSSMLAMESSVGVRANIGAISSMMSQHGQNGVNSDVVAAIDKLNKKMDNLGNTTYMINGVTYDDGSNINDAVATLVRAARIERRV